MVLIFSFMHSFFEARHEYNFLIIFTRAWELMAGGLLAAYLVNNTITPNRFLAFAGFLLVTFSYLFPYAVSNNQALVNLFPVAGAFLIIAFSGEKSTLIGRFLSWKPIVFIGLLSYSIYLWHQPLIAFYRLASEYQPDPYVLAVVSLFSIPLAYLSWRFIENPARNFKIMPAKVFYPLLIMVVMAVAGIGVLMHKTYGFESHFSDYSYEGNPQAYVDRIYDYKVISGESAGKPRLVVLGNSFARDFVNIYKESSLNGMYEVVYEPDGCNISTERLESILGGSKYVFLASNWAQEEPADVAYAKLEKCVVDLEGRLQGRELFIIGVKNFGWNNNFVKLKSRDQLFSAVTKPLDGVLEFNRMAADGFDNYVDILALILDEDGQVPIFTDENKFITYDTNHLTRPGAKYLSGMLFEKTQLSRLKEVLLHVD